MADYEIIPYRPELREQVIDLRRNAYESDFPESAAYLDWKYGLNPYLKEPIFYLALYGGHVVGMRGFHGTCWYAGGAKTPIVLPCADDFAIARAHRNSGLATRIMRLALDDLARRGHSYVVNTSGGNLTVLSSLAMGWKSVGAMEPVARVRADIRLGLAVRERLRTTPVLWRTVLRTDKLRTAGSEVFERLDRAGTRPADAPGARITVASHPRIVEMSDLAARLADRTRIRHARDEAFMAWRYRNPIREYRFLFYEREGKLEGYLAVARYLGYRSPEQPFHIADLEGSTPGIRSQLLKNAIAWGRFAELGAWLGTAGPEHRALLARAGFRPAETHLAARGLPCVLIRRLGPPSEAAWTLGDLRVLETSNWDIRLVDSMRG